MNYTIYYNTHTHIHTPKEKKKKKKMTAGIIALHKFE